MNNLNTIDNILNELATLYIPVKEAYILLEESNPDQSAYMGPINEFRNALDHIMKIIYNKDEEEFNKAKSHLLRAGCDSYEFACSEMIIFIEGLMRQYTAEEIVSVLPNYFEMRVKVIEIQEKIAEYREIKEEKVFNYYRETISELLKYKKAILNKLPFLIELHKKNTKAKNISLFIGIAGAIIGIAGIIIALLK